MSLLAVQEHLRATGHAFAIGERLIGGLSNRSYSCILDGKNGVLRLTKGPRGSRISVQSEVALMSRLGSISPRVLASGPGWMVTAFVPHTPISPTHIGVSLARLHQLPCSVDLRTLPIYVLLRELSWPSNLRHLAPCAEVIAAQLHGLPLTLCHQDLTLGNLRGEVFLDWEYAAVSNPGFDVSTLLSELPADDGRTFLATYQQEGGPGMSSEPMRAALKLVNTHWYATHPHQDIGLS